MISEVFTTANSDLNGDNPQFTVTCLSVGGPVSSVQWLRNHEIPNPNTTSSLLDPVEEHNLTMSEVASGYYTCVLRNNQPNVQYGDINTEGKYILSKQENSLLGPKVC